MSAASNKRLLFILLPMLVAFGTLIGIYFSLKPKMQTWMLRQVDRLSAEKLPVNIKITKIDWTLLFPEIELEGLVLTPKPELAEDMPPLQIQKISASLDLLAIFAGRIAISSLLIEKPILEVSLDKYLTSTGPAEPLPLQAFFDLLKKVPVSRLGLKQAQITLLSQKWEGVLKLNSADLLVINKKDHLDLQFDLNESSLSYKKASEIPFRLQGDASLNADNLDISNLKLGTLNSLITVNGALSDIQRVHIKPEGTLEFEVFSDLAQTATAAKQFFSFPNLNGSLKTSGRFQIDRTGQIQSAFKFLGQKLKINQFDIGDMQFEGSFAENHLKISDIALTNEAGLVDIRDLSLEIKKDDEQKVFISVDGQVSTQQVDLNELLIRIGVGDIPLEAFLATKLHCRGPLFPEPEVLCKGEAQAEQLEVSSGNKYTDVIVQVDEFSALGELTITSRSINYKTQIKVQEDEGRSDGVISYNEGFKINYSSPDLHFKNIRNLAGLKLEGHGSVQGSTAGNSHSATFRMNLAPQQFVFEDFILGDVTGSLAYEKSVLHFTGIQGFLGLPSNTPTKYLANVDVDLHRKRIKAQGQLPQFDLGEVLSIFDRRFKMPVEVTGSGTANLQVEGPFELGKLSYDINTVLYRGSAVGESFDRAEVSLHSESGEMKVKKARLTKNRSEINLSGLSHPDGKIEINIIGQKFPLEESDNISRLGSQISGLLDFDMNLTGFVLAPDSKLKARIYQVNVEEKDFPDSTLSLDISKQSLNGMTNLFGGQLKSDFAIPLTESAPFKLTMTARDWNYTTLFALIGGGSLLNDYKALMTGDLDLASNHGGLWAASGRGTVQTLTLQRGSLSLKNPRPLLMEMKNGVIGLSHFRLEGDQTFFDIKGKEFSKEDFRLNVDGQANLRLFQIFVPFLEELAGSAKISVDTSGTLGKPQILGSANVKGAFVKIKGFPHPFEKIQADVQFSQSKILINNFVGSIAGGSFNGDGSVMIEGPRDFPTNVKAHLANVNFNVPDRVRTSGEADVVFSGNWFPFTLSGNYHVVDGFVDKEFGDELSGNNLRQSSYLPKMILQGAFEPVVLNLAINLDRPLKIKNSLVDGSVSGSLTVKGAPTQPALGGNLATEKGSKIIFRDKVFDVQTANIQFAGDSVINPELYISANSRITDYDVSMLIQGTARTPVVRMNSVPPLSENDIASLIALGVTSQKLEKQVEQRNTNSSGENLKGVVGGVLSQTPIFKKAQTVTGVELQVSSSYDDTKNVSVQRITLSKKLSDRVKASATQVAGNRSAKEFALQYKLTNSVSAIGRYEDRQPADNSAIVDKASTESQSILGIDLEYKQEFK